MSLCGCCKHPWYVALHEISYHGIALTFYLTILMGHFTFALGDTQKVQ
jgi:hypothetical protein